MPTEGTGQGLQKKAEGVRDHGGKAAHDPEEAGEHNLPATSIEAKFRSDRFLHCAIH
jgi:hypothetical protein